MFCNNCGKQLEENIRFCEECGLEVTVANEPVIQPNVQIQVPKKTKRKHGWLKALMVLAVFFCIGVLSVYLFIPGMLRPYDLGVELSQESYDSAMQKLNLIKDISPKEGKAKDYIYTYGSLNSVDVALNSEEITSFFNINRPNYYAIKNVQVRINDDNTIESCATVDVSYVFNEILDNRYSKEDAKAALPMLGLLPSRVNIYFKVEGGITNNKTDIKIKKVSVMGITIPQSMSSTSSATDFIKDSFDGYLDRIEERNGTRYDSLNVSDGSINLKCQVPSSITRKPVE